MNWRVCCGVISLLSLVILIYLMIRAYQKPGSEEDATARRIRRQIDQAITDLAGSDVVRHIEAEATLTSIRGPAVEPLIVAFRAGAYGTFDYNQLNGPTKYAKVLGLIGDYRALDVLLEFLEGGRNYPEQRRRYWYSNLAAEVIMAVRLLQTLPMSAPLPPVSDPAWEDIVTNASRLNARIADILVCMGLHADTPERDIWAYNLLKGYRDADAALLLISALEQENLKRRGKGCLVSMLPSTYSQIRYEWGQVSCWLNALGDSFISMGPPMADTLIKLIEMGTEDSSSMFGYYVVEAARALGEIGDLRAINALRNLSKVSVSRSEWTADVAKAAQQALQRLSERGLVDSSVEAEQLPNNHPNSEQIPPAQDANESEPSTMIPCPDCGNSVSTSATRCRKCGHGFW